MKVLGSAGTTCKTPCLWGKMDQSIPPPRGVEWLGRCWWRLSIGYFWIHYDSFRACKQQSISVFCDLWILMNFNWGSHRNEVELVETPLCRKRMEKDGDYPVAIAWSTWLDKLKESRITGRCNHGGCKLLLLHASDIAATCFPLHGNPKISLVATVLSPNRNNHTSRLFLCRFPTVTFSNFPGVSLRDGYPMLQVHDLDSYVTPGPGTYNAHTTSFVYWATAQPCLAHRLPVFFDGGVGTLGGWLFWWRSWLFADSQIHSCFKEIVFSLSLKEGLSCKTSILLQANYMWSSKILKAGPVGWGLAQEWGTSERQTIDYLRSTWFNMGYFMMFVRSGIDNHPIVEVISYPHVLLCVD